MAKKRDWKKSKKTVEEKMAAEAICPSCGKEVPTHKCRFCGAVKTINNVSGNVIWMKNGRLVGAFRDERDAYIKMARQHGIPEKKWPKKFRGGD